MQLMRMCFKSGWIINGSVGHVAKCFPELSWKKRDMETLMAMVCLSVCVCDRREINTFTDFCPTIILNIFHLNTEVHLKYGNIAGGAMAHI